MSTADKLLIGRNPDVPTGPFDGRVAAVVGEFVCTTPNQTRIFFPSMQKVEVKLRADARYGPDDPTLWPQPWVEMFCHLGAIPRKPNDPNDSLSIMWWDPADDDFKLFDGSLVGGLGELSGSKLVILQRMLSSIEDRIEDHKRTFPKTNKHLLLLVRAMQDSFARLKSLKTKFTEMRLAVTEFQRYYLETYGCLDYLEIYKPRMEGLRPQAESVENCVGAFTHSARTVQEFCNAGLPVWFLRPSSDWDSPMRCNILEIVTPLDPADILCVMEHYPLFPAIFWGSSADPKKHIAFLTHSRMRLVFKDPFEGPKVSISHSSSLFASSASSSQATSSSQAANRGKTNRSERSRGSARGAPYTKPDNTQTGERNKYSPLQSPYAPYPIPAWSAALQAVDPSPSNLVEASKTSQIYGHYTFPDPGLFIHPSTAGKYIGSWLRVREIWLMRLTKEPSLALSNQSWRTFLSIDNAAQGKQDTKAALRRREVLDVVLPNSDMYPGVERRSSLTEQITWRGREYSSGVLPPENVVREILWELYEMNFIHELQSLDRRACRDLNLSSVTELFDREIEISQCFPTSSFQPVSIPFENIGLADDDFDKRFRFVTALVFVMERWKGEKPDMLAGDIFDLQLSPDGAMKLEEIVAKYYCQQFFNYFGRAAQIPHRLFATSRS